MLTLHSAPLPTLSALERLFVGLSNKKEITMSTLSQSYNMPTSLGAPASSSINLLARLRSLVTRQRPVDPIEDFINANGGVLTDQLERDISRRFGSQPG
jgi:hypothetical protein